LIAESWCNSKSTDYCTRADAMEEVFHIFLTFSAWNPCFFIGFCKVAHKMVHWAGCGTFFSLGK
jgi:hypothetical protein